jgi:hypothetical protein
MNEKVDRKLEVLRKEVESREPSSREPVQGDSLGQDRRALEAGASTDRSYHEALHRVNQGKKRPRYRVRLRPISPAKYPQYAKDRDHPFASMEAAQRVAEIDAFLGLLWARTCRERKEQTARPLRAAA